jgi:transcription antitermination protein NusB
MTGRRKARELVLKALYAYEMLPRDISQIYDELADGNAMGQENLDFARHYMDTVLKNQDQLDRLITKLADNWDLDRIAVIDKIILRMALAELYFMPDIPEKAAINEAIDLAKQYSTLESSSFVNGILDTALAESRHKPAE